MAPVTALHAPRIFDGHRWHDGAALLVQDGRVAGIVPWAAAPAGQVLDLPLVPGLVDLQVNGGGGVLFNDATDVDGIKSICAAHARFGTTATLVTLITDTPDVTARAIAAGRHVQEGGAGDVPGFLGLHLEGPHLAVARKGTHDPALIRAMEDADLAALTTTGLAHLVCTVAPESVTPDQIAALAQAGVTVSLGHTDADHATALACVEAGARMVTHLFNAMSPLGHRAPGLVGAALDDGRLWAGIIADGFHVDAASLRIALRAKAGPAGLFAVSDAMSTVGTGLHELHLNGRRILRQGGRLTLACGTLAGADIALIDAVRWLHVTLGLDLGDALALATTAPAAAMGLSDRGHLNPGARADFFALGPGITADAVWIGGVRQ